MNKLKVAIIFGGKSTEHEVSRISASSIIKNLDKNKYELYLLGITKVGKWMLFEGDIDKIASGEWEKEGIPAFISPDSSIKGIVKTTDNGCETIKIDVAFPVLHGLYGEDGTIQGLFELAGIPYVGPGVLASSVGMDKIYTKIVFKDKGIPQCKYIWANKIDIDSNINKVADEIELKLGYPCFVKPSNSGSSVGIEKAHDRDELLEGLRTACIYDRKILIEEGVNCRELECAVLGNDNPMASVIGEIVPSKEFYDYEAKYQSDSKCYIPAQIDNELSDKIRKMAVDAYKAIDAKGLTRVDFFLEKTTGEIFVNEVNTLPGFTSISMYPKLWEATGIGYSELIDKLIEYAIER